MQPTPHASVLVVQVRQALELLRNVTRQQAVFDAAKAARTFRICVTDITHLALLPGLINRLSNIAPSIQVPLSNFEWVDSELVGFGRAGGVKGGRSPAQRTLGAARASPDAGLMSNAAC